MSLIYRGARLKIIKRLPRLALLMENYEVVCLKYIMLFMRVTLISLIFKMSIDQIIQTHPFLINKFCQKKVPPLHSRPRQRDWVRNEQWFQVNTFRTHVVDQP